MKICSICGSDKKVCRFKNGELYCNKHYNQMYKSGYCTFENKKKREGNILSKDEIEFIAKVHKSFVNDEGSDDYISELKDFISKKLKEEIKI